MRINTNQKKTDKTYTHKTGFILFTPDKIKRVTTITQKEKGIA